ncbi:MAG TPA: recombinase family protein [Candidatus Saccharimonadales bacterium]|nr:recombinase family protein [Candidatus Saccharimonadales bacterium]
MSKIETSSVILARVSSKAQEDEGYSLDSQSKLLANYCESKGFEVVKTFRITETASKQQSRKIFQELMAYMLENKIYHLVVEKTDRLTRNFRDAVAIDDWLDGNENRMLHAVKENLLLHKNAKSDVKFMWSIHLSVAKKYTDNLREEAMKGWAEKLAQGWLPSPPPPGYMTITQNGKRIHVPDPASHGIMHSIFKKYLDPGHSVNSIAREMDILGLKTKMGRPFSKSHVHRILSNTFYIGINHFDGKDYPGAQETFISKELFDQVQGKLHKGRPTRLYRHNPVLKNVITCEDCGGMVTWQYQKGRYYGACQRRNKSCSSVKFLREDKVEEAIIKELEKLVSPSQEVIDWVASSMREEHQINIDNREKMLASMETQLVRLERMDNELYDDKLAGVIPLDKYEIKHAQFMAQKNDIEVKRAEIDVSIAKGLEQRLIILELSQKAASIYQMRSPDQKRLIITKLFANITYKGGLVSVNYTNFSRAIAERVLKTSNLLGGKLWLTKL